MLKPPLNDFQKTIRTMHLPLLKLIEGEWVFVDNGNSTDWIEVPNEPASPCPRELMNVAETHMKNQQCGELMKLNFDLILKN